MGPAGVFGHFGAVSFNGNFAVALTPALEETSTSRMANSSLEVAVASTTIFLAVALRMLGFEVWAKGYGQLILFERKFFS